LQDFDQMTNNMKPSEMRDVTHHDDGDIVYPAAVPFILVHLVCGAAYWTGITTTSIVIAVSFYWLWMFAIGGGYHRYFSHRSYKTGRVFQFIMAFIAQSTTQKSVIWWAAKHRHHHRHSDTELDVHSPVRRSFFYSHMGWIFDTKHGNEAFDHSTVQDLLRYPELRFLHRFEQLPSVVAVFICYLIGGLPGVVVGFFWSTVAVYHGTFCINSLAHVHGSKRYVTGDESRNNPILAFFTMGEGWHNNHHAYQYSVRQGFKWWEWDPTYYLLKALEKIGVVWDLKAPPAAILTNEQMLPPRVIERSAERLVASFSVETIVHSIQEAYAASPSVDELRASVRTAQMAWMAQTSERFANVHMPQIAWPEMQHIPTVEDMKEKARALFVATPSMDQIVIRAHQMLNEAVWGRLGVSDSQAA
jgi:stearoyl-CoA desaturase (Delta-9 desaturase)